MANGGGHYLFRVKLTTFVFAAILSWNKISWQSVSAYPCNANYTILGYTDVTLGTGYVPECTTSSVFKVVTVNISLYGISARTGYPESVSAFTPGINGGTIVTCTPTTSGTATYLKWDVLTNNTCMSIGNTTTTVATCQYDLLISNFSASNYFDYEALYATGFLGYTCSMLLYRTTSNACSWAILSNITVYLQDCNEYPYFSPSMGTTYYLVEYQNGTNMASYAGTICNIYALDPDIYNGRYGAVSLSVAAVTRPLVGGVAVTTAPFVITGTSFSSGTNSNTSVLYYDVNRCTNVSACVAMFNSKADGGSFSILWVIITATDGGGLQKNLTITLNITASNAIIATTTPPTTTTTTAPSGVSNKPQPTMTRTTDSVSVRDDTAQQSCIYNMDTVTLPAPGPALLTYKIKTITQVGHNNMWYIDGPAVCFQGNSTVNVGTCCNKVFRVAYSPYVMTVQVNDLMSNSTAYPTFTLTVSIFTNGDPPQLYAPSSLTVVENAATFSFAINATQFYPAPGLTQPLRFNLTGFSRTFNDMYFSITSQTATLNQGYATISAGGPRQPFFSVLTAPVIFINITVTDTLYTVTSTVTVNVQYVAGAPYATNLPGTVNLLESVTGIGAFYTVAATDKDNDPISFSFAQGDNLVQTYSYFSLNYYSGAVFYVNPVFNSQATSSYTLYILVQDHPSSSGAGNATTGPLPLFVNITRQNLAPTFNYPLPGSGRPGSNLSVSDALTGQGTILSFTASDQENDKVYYNITSMTPVWNPALVIEWGKNTLDYNQNYAMSNPMFNTSQPYYIIAVEAKDVSHLANATSTTTLTVWVTHNDVPAKWVSLPGYVTIRDDVVYGPTELYSIAAMDPNGKNYPISINFLQILPSSGTSKFYYDTGSKIFGFVNNPQFNYSTQSSYSAYFTASNTINPPVTSSILITISQTMSSTGPVTYTYNYNVSIREDTTSSLLLWDLRSKAGSSSAIQFSLYGVTPTSSAFTVTSQGQIKSVANPGFSYDKVSYYIVTAISNDPTQQNLKTTFSLTVSIQAVPKSPTVWNMPYTVYVQEGKGTSQTLFSVNCTDTRSSLIWSLSVLPASGSSYFAISSSGVIATQSYANFTYLAQPSYRVVVYCANTQLLTATGALVVVVTTAPVITTAPTPTTGATMSSSTSNSDSTTQLPPETIGAIVGSIGGALCLAGAAYGIAKYLQKQVASQGIDKMMRQPVYNANW